MAVKDLFHDLSVEVALDGQNIASATTVNGNDITHADFQSVTFVGVLGPYTDGDYAIGLEEDTDDGSGNPSGSWTDVASDDLLGTAPTISTAGWFKLGYRGVEPHVRLTVTSTSVTTGAYISANALLSHARRAPFTATT